MVNSAMTHNIRWMAPSPLWGEQSAWMRLPMQNQQVRPIILRFANDMFMDELIAMLSHSPWRLDEWVAQNETWRKPMPNPEPIEVSRPAVTLPESYNMPNRLVQNYPRATRLDRIKSFVKTSATDTQFPSEEPIKLYHANHQRYYVVTASLVSEEKGYPDYQINLGHDERASFVVRALVKNQETNCDDEYGFVATSSGMAWRRLGVHEIESTAVQKIMPNEDRLPLFPLTYPDHCGRLRRLFGALIPVGKRDEWIDAPEATDNAGIDVKIASPVVSNSGGEYHYNEILYNDVIAPWKALIDRAETDKRKNNTEKNPFPNFSWDKDAKDAADTDKIKNLRAARDEIQTASWYVLHDFAQFLKDHFPNVLNNLRVAFKLPESVRVELTGREEELFKILMNTKMAPRLFIQLAIENLAIGGFTSAPGVFLWDILIDIAELEFYLNLSNALYMTKKDFIDKLCEKLKIVEEKSLQILGIKTFQMSGNYSGMPGENLQSALSETPMILDARRSLNFARNCLVVIDEFKKQTSQTFLDFVQQLEISYRDLKSNVVDKVPVTNHPEAEFLWRILQQIELPSVRSDVQREIDEYISGDIKITTSQSMWDLLSYYWKFEAYINANVKKIDFNDIKEILISGQSGSISDLKDQILERFYDGSGQTNGWYSFAQFVDDLKKGYPSLYNAVIRAAIDKLKNFIEEPQRAGVYAEQEQTELISALQDAEITNDVHNVLSYTNPDDRKIRIISSLAEALVEVLYGNDNWTDVLENVDTPYDRSLMSDKDIIAKDKWWPDFLFPLTDPEPTLNWEESHIVPVPEDSAAVADVETLKSRLDLLADLLAPKQPPEEGRSAVLGMNPLLTEKNPRFVVRFIFERPQCGSLFLPLVSQPTRQIQLALFMDPDAPARTVHVHMPLDISPAGLRKYKKNAMFVLSDMMCGKLKNVRKLTLADLVLSVLPWPFHKDLPDVGNNAGPCNDGLICSLSIPIVTLCAMILLFIMVSLFEMIFKWMPWFFVCFPVPGLPGLKIKKNENPSGEKS